MLIVIFITNHLYQFFRCKLENDFPGGMRALLSDFGDCNFRHMNSLSAETITKNQNSSSIRCDNNLINNNINVNNYYNSDRSSIINSCYSRTSGSILEDVCQARGSEGSINDTKPASTDNNQTIDKFAANREEKGPPESKAGAGAES